MNEPSRETEMLMRFGPLLIALWGWASLALAVSTRVPFLVLAVIGLTASAGARRSPRITALIEVAAMGAIVVAAPPDAIGFLAIGAILVVIARAVMMAIRRTE